jgi:hypothetical protein
MQVACVRPHRCVGWIVVFYFVGLMLKSCSPWRDGQDTSQRSVLANRQREIPRSALRRCDLADENRVVRRRRATWNEIQRFRGSVMSSLHCFILATRSTSKSRADFWQYDANKIQKQVPSGCGNNKHLPGKTLEATARRQDHHSAIWCCRRISTDRAACLCISKFMVLELFIAVFIARCSIWLAAKVRMTSPPQGHSVELPKTMLLFVR